MPHEITDYLFIDETDEAIEECGYRADDAAIRHGEELARRTKHVVRVCKIIDVIDPTELRA